MATLIVSLIGIAGALFMIRFLLALLIDTLRFRPYRLAQTADCNLWPAEEARDARDQRPAVLYPVQSQEKTRDAAKAAGNLIGFPAPTRRAARR